MPSDYIQGKLDGLAEAEKSPKQIVDVPEVKVVIDAVGNIVVTATTDNGKEIPLLNGGRIDSIIVEYKGRFSKYGPHT